MFIVTERENKLNQYLYKNVFMEILINNSTLQRVFNKFMDNYFNDLKRVKSYHFPMSEFFLDKNGDVKSELILSEKHGNWIVIDWSLWNELRTIFPMERIPETQKYIEEWGKNKFGVDSMGSDFKDFVESEEDILPY
jgi:hypothetical protein